MTQPTANEETPRTTCCTCGAEIHEDGCYSCEERDMLTGDEATGYEADDERPYGWDVPEEEYPDW